MWMVTWTQNLRWDILKRSKTDVSPSPIPIHPDCCSNDTHGITVSQYNAKQSEILTLSSENTSIGQQAWQVWRASWGWTGTGPQSWHQRWSRETWGQSRKLSLSGRSSTRRFPRPPSPSTRSLRQWQSLQNLLAQLVGPVRRQVVQAWECLFRKNLKAVLLMWNTLLPLLDWQIQVNWAL